MTGALMAGLQAGGLVAFLVAAVDGLARSYSSTRVRHQAKAGRDFHSSYSGPYPRHLTRYCITGARPKVRVRRPTSLSTSYDFSSWGKMVPPI